MSKDCKCKCVSIDTVIYTVCTIENLGNYIDPYADDMLADRKKIL